MRLQANTALRILHETVNIANLPPLLLVAASASGRASAFLRIDW
jgi:hypothetical protein